MNITPDATIADIATAAPATIRVFQQHQIDFCCGGRLPLAQVCADRGLDADLLVTQLVAAATPAAAEPSWADASLSALIAHIQQRYHVHLRSELPRLDAMLDKVVSRHGDRLPEVLLPLQHTYKGLLEELVEHMAKEDRLLFPMIEALEQGTAVAADAMSSLTAPMSVLIEEHQAAGAAIATMRSLTKGFAPPEWACPTFRGLYFGLAQLETDMHLHVHLENHILFPRAATLARRRS